MEVEHLKSPNNGKFMISYVGSHGVPLPEDQAIVLNLMDRTFSLLPGADNRCLDRVVMDNKIYLIGVQLAHLTKRTTYNLYRAMRSHGVEPIRASPSQLKHFRSTPIPFLTSQTNARSVTFVPLEQALQFFLQDFRRLEAGHIKSLGKSAKSKKRPLSTAEEVEAKKSNTEATNSGSDHDAVEEDEFAERA